MVGLTINVVNGLKNIHTYKSYGMRMTDMNIPMPSVVTRKVEIPMSHNVVDMTDVDGGPYYAIRQNVSFSFVIYDKNYTQWANVYSKISNEINGKDLEVILDTDKSYFYKMRLFVSSIKSNKASSKIVLEGTAEPFKYCINDSLQDWVWDSFNFENGTTQPFKGIELDNGQSIIRIPAGRMEVIPEFKLYEGHVVVTTDDNNYYDLIEGKIARFPQIKVNGIKPVNLIFYIYRAAKLDIIFRGGSL